MGNTIAELEKALQALRESEEIMRYIVRHDPNAIAIYDGQLKYLAVSERYLQDYNVKEEDIIGRHHYEVFPEIPQRWREIHQRCLQGEILRNEDDYFERPDGSLTYNKWECRPWRRMNGEIGGMITYTEVTTEKKKAELVLKENEARYRYIFANNPQPMWIYDMDTLAFLEVNDAAITHYGYSREEFMHMTLRDIRPPDDIPLLTQSISRQSSSDSPAQRWRHCKKNGEIIYVEIAAHPILFEGRPARHILINDITRRKEAEDKTRHLSRLYALLSQINQAVVKIKDQKLLLDKICQVAVEYGQFEMAWIGSLEETSGKIKPLVWAGSENGYIAQACHILEKLDTSYGPTVLAIRQGKIATSTDIATDPGMLPWRKLALQRGYRSSASVPIRCNGKVWGALSLYAKDPGFFVAEEQRLLHEIGEDISYALDSIAIEAENKRARQQLTDSEFRYRRLFESSKDAILLVEADSGIVMDVNASLTDLSGYASEDFLNKPVWENEFLKQIVPDAALYHSYEKRYVQQIIEKLLRHKEGNTIYTEVVLNSYPVNSRMMVQCNLRNISKRKVAELKLKDALTEAQRFRQSLDHVSSYIYMKDLQSRYIYANKHTLELFGCTPETLAGKDDESFFSPQTTLHSRESDQQVFQGGESIREIVVNDPRKGPRVYLDVKVPMYASQDDDTICGLLGISTDITEQKTIENKLKESEERFRTVAQSITDVIYEYDMNHHIDWYGDIDQMMGYPTGAFPRNFESLQQLVHPEDRQRLLDSLKSILENGFSNNIEYRVRKNNGDWCIWSARRTLIKDSEGKAVKMIGSITDITERTRIRNEIKFQADLLSNVGQAVVATNNQSQVTYLNKAAEKMYGWTIAQAVGKDVMQVNPVEVNPQLIQEIVDTTSRGNSWSGELWVKRGEGNRFPVHVINSPIYDSSGQLSGMVSIANDITERKRSEEKILTLSRAFEQTVDSIIITDRQGIIQYVNTAFETISGYGAQEVLGRTPSIVKSGYYDPGFYEHMWSVILSGKVYRKEMINKKKNGDLYYVEKTISPIMDPQGNITHFVGTGVDISERKRAEQELIKAKEKAEESDRLKSAFLANMSHEIRTPLNSIVGFSSLLADAEFNKVQRDELIGHIIKNGNQLLGIISDIMDISKIESGTLTIQKTPLAAHALVSSNLEPFRLEAQEKNLELVIHSDQPDENLWVVADSQRFTQVLSNLLSNAIKFTEHGKIEVGYCLQGNRVEFSVSDTGIGIPKEFHHKIFERFRQVETERTRKYGGNGLGLSITKKLVELMEGSIWLDSEPDKGTVFYFTLPLHQQ